MDTSQFASVNYFYQAPRSFSIFIITTIMIVIALVIIAIAILYFASIKKKCSSAPPTPTNVKVGYIDGNTFRVQWNRIADVTSYKVYVSRESGFNRVDSLYSAETTVAYADIIGLDREVRYYFFVTALNSCGESDNTIEYNYYFSQS